MKRLIMAAVLAGVAVGTARAQDEVPAWFTAYLESGQLMAAPAGEAVPLEIPEARGEDAVRIDIAPDASGGSIAADASDPGGVWAWITGNPIKSTLISAGSTYLIVQGTRGKLGTDMRGLSRAVGLSEHDSALMPAPTDPDRGSAGGGTAKAPPGGTAINLKVEAADSARVTIVIGDGNGQGGSEEQ